MMTISLGRLLKLLNNTSKCIYISNWFSQNKDPQKNFFLNRYCRQVLCETVRTAKLTPVSARLQDIEGKIDKFIIPREVGNIWYA